jgi:hypothetical protein
MEIVAAVPSLNCDDEAAACVAAEVDAGHDDRHPDERRGERKWTSSVMAWRKDQ